MKHRFFFAIASAALLLSSCGEKWLDVASKTQILESNYYNSEERLFTAVVFYLLSFSYLLINYLFFKKLQKK